MARFEDARALGFAGWVAMFGEPESVEGDNAIYHVPWREDKHPSLKVLMKAKGEFQAGFWKDFGRGDSGDLVSAVARKMNCEPPEALDAIARTCSLNGYGAGQEETGAPPAVKAQALAPTQSGLAAEYGLQWEDFARHGCEWRGRTVAYPILKADGTRVWKQKTTTRDEKKNKRDSFAEQGSGFQHGLFDCGLSECEGALLVLAGGEEKAMAAHLAGFPAVSVPNGEESVSDTTLKMVVAAKPARVVVAFDADKAGRDGADKVATKLRAAGMSVSVVDWPEGSPSGFDLTDVCLQGGPEAVRELIEETRRPRCAWKPIPLSDLYARQPPTKYLVEDLIPAGTAGIVSGAGGSLKSNWLFDMCVAVASGRRLLVPPEGQPGRSFATIKSAVAWYNCDNPTVAVKRRFGAFMRGHGVTDRSPIEIYPVSFPDESPLNLSKPESVETLRSFMLIYRPAILVIDNLQTVAGVEDENSAAQMGPAMTQIRRIIEATGSTVILIHHHNKEDKMRGSSSIRDLVDWTLTVKREADSETITVKPDKERDATKATFKATFTYEHYEGTRDLESARFIPAEFGETKDDADLEAAILDTLRDNGAGSVREIRTRIKKGNQPVQDALASMHRRGIVRREMTKNAKGWVYFVEHEEKTRPTGAN